MELLKIQGNIQEQIKKSKINFYKSPKDRLTKAYMETRLQSIDAKWSEYTANHYKLLQLEEISDNKYFKESVYEAMEEFYIEFKSELRDLIEKQFSRPIVQESSQSEFNSFNTACSMKSNIKLPKISIPFFSGRYTEWVSFRDLFISLIHNNTSIDDVQKLHYLKGHLTGEAEQLLRHIPITNDNYIQCWTMLENRYDNKQYLVNCILNGFFSKKKIFTESATAIKEMLNCTIDMLNGMKGLGVNVESWDILVIYIVCLKLDQESRKQWEANVSELISQSNQLPDFTQFKDFLEKRYHSLEYLDPKVNEFNKPREYNRNQATTGTSKIVSMLGTELVCIYCKGDHRLSNCKDFSSLDYDGKREFVQGNNICFNCLTPRHSAKYCRSPTCCKICNRRHHSLLHPKPVTSMVGRDHDTTVDEPCQVETSLVQNLPSSLSSEPETLHLNSHFSKGNLQHVLLATALVEIDSYNDQGQTFRALIDQGSQASFVTEAVVQLLGLKRISVNSRISGLGHGKSISSRAMVTLKIRSRTQPDCVMEIKAYILNKITSLLPSTTVTLNSWPELDGMNLADPAYHTPNKIDILLGADVYGTIILEGLIKSPTGTVVAQNTTLGWIVSGLVGSKGALSCEITSMHAQLDTLLKSFWEIESEPVNLKKIMSLEERQCEELFKSTTQRDEGGRFVVKLPFRDTNPSCQYGDSRLIAQRRHFTLEKRLQHDSYLKEEYEKTFKEYLELNHMQLVSENDSDRKVFLPHHAVVREDKDTTKVRIIFDASCKNSNGRSLNDDLMVGPTLQLELRHILLRWRRHPICLCADIIKMYRQIRINPEDTRFQCILWRANPNDTLQEFKLQRLTFGISSAPYIAVKCLMQLAQEEGKDFPHAAERLTYDCYMDDIMTGCQKKDDALKIYKEMNELLQRGGFQLQKWTSNDESVLNAIQKAKGSTDNKRNLEFQQNSISKILGLTWDRCTDEFLYAVKLPPVSHPITKRKVVSDIAKLYDPLGWIAPSIIIAKVFIQKLWLSGLLWDEELGEELLHEWLTYREDLDKLETFRLPRWLNQRDGDSFIELHGFSDASNIAYSAVVYMRVIDSEDNRHVSLVAARTKVAPIKQISIPRLELCGAVLVTKLLIEVASVLDVHKTYIHAWTDSQVVLAWLSSHPSKWKTYIGNRVSEIISLLDRNQWAYVHSEDNPADCASRGVNPSEIAYHKLWLDGPAWLKNRDIVYTNPETYPKLEEKAVKVHTTLMGMQDDPWSKFSTLNKLLRVVAYCRRFLKKGKNNHVYLTKEEIMGSLDVIIKRVQTQEFEADISDIKKGKQLSKKSKLASLNPYVDECGLLRVGGRLDRANLPLDQKHPILLPKTSFLTSLIIGDAHVKTLHGGPQLMLTFLRSKYYIVGVKNSVKHHVKKCVVCTRYAAVTRNPLMGQLPTPRVTITKPFSSSAVDYAGPINLRMSKGRGQRSYKGYICIFVCMSTRAVHIEAVTDLSSQGFLAAFKRFVARRGHCNDLYSDNGTNFVGSARELKHLFNEEQSAILPEIVSSLANNGTQWHFIPPRSPNFGGLWEAAVKSTKFHMKRVIESTLTFEEITTLLSQIEACLNSRPISYTESQEELMPLTPGHFLVGEPLLVAPDRNYEQSSISSLRRWQLCQRMLQDFWRKWSNEYLTRYLHRYRWSQHVPEPSIGAVVLVKENDLPPAR